MTLVIDFRLLGNVEALRNGEVLALGSTRPRGVLAALLVDANKPVSLDELATRVWGDDAPRQVHSSLHSYFTRLRHALAADCAITRSGHGYQLRTEPDTIDLYRFRGHVELARRSERPEQALDHFNAALGLWRGDPFSGLDSLWFDDVRAALRIEHESIMLDQVDVRLRLGQDAQLAAELSLRAQHHPLNERLAAQLMLALYRSDRQADALLHFQKVKTALADELGVDPGVTLRTLYQSILREDPRLRQPGRPDTAPVATAPAPASEPDAEPQTIVPRQLPSVPRSLFVGRDAELATLSDVLAPADGTSRLSVIAGAGGMGKTWLALQWAHQHRELFPDGQLFINLRGFEPSLDRMSPYQAMRGFLLAFHVTPDRIPDDPEAMTGLYHSVLADKRLLIVVDNARDADQVTALVPGSASCSMVVTSRNRLTSLVTSHNANLLTLGVLNAEDARQLLTARLGPRRAAAEPAALGQLSEACGGLPLALAITVGRAQEHPDFPLASLVAELRDAGSTLNALDVDTNLSVRAVLSTSHAALPATQAEVFRLLGLVPGPDIDLRAASALTGRSHAATRTVLRELERASLIAQPSPGRFRMHDLVRLYAREQAAEHLADPTRTTALRRLAAYYLHTAILAAELVDPDRPKITVEPAPDGCQPLPLRDTDQAWQWFDCEEPNLRAIHDLARECTWHDVVWALTWAATNFYARLMQSREMVNIWRAAVMAAEALGEPAKLTLARRFLSRPLAWLGHHDEALRHADAGVELAEQSGDVAERLFMLRARSELHGLAGRTKLSAEDAILSWQLAQDQSVSMRLHVASSAAFCLAQDGRYDSARELADIALDLADEIGSPDQRITVIDTLGYIALHTGQLDQAVGYLNEAAKFTSGPHYAGELANTLYTLGKTYAKLGRRDEARDNLERALRLYREQHRIDNIREAEEALAQLSEY